MNNKLRYYLCKKDRDYLAFLPNVILCNCRARNRNFTEFMKITLLENSNRTTSVNNGIITYYLTFTNMRFGFLFSIVLIFTLLVVAESKKITPDECKGRIWFYFA